MDYDVPLSSLTTFTPIRKLSKRLNATSTLNCGNLGIRHADNGVTTITDHTTMSMVNLTSSSPLGDYDVPRAHFSRISLQNSSFAPLERSNSNIASFEGDSSLTLSASSFDHTQNEDLYSRPRMLATSSSASAMTPKTPKANNKTSEATVASILTGDRLLNMDSLCCARCNEGFDPKEKVVNCNGELFHERCFVCAQCFRPFPDGVFYEFEGRKYCEHDFHVLFAPCCGKCGDFIVGRVIKAMNSSWHPECFTCEMCNKELADLGFVKHQSRAICHECNAKVKAQPRDAHMCQICHSLIEGQPLFFRGEPYCPWHFNCTACGIELTATAREVKSRPGFTANELNELYCLRCHDKMGIPICAACRRPIEDRVVTALGKHWCVEHFVCAFCEKPFLGKRHYERKGLAYCEMHYHQLFGNLCYISNTVIKGDMVKALNKAWCVDNFACSSCDKKMTAKTKFYEVDLKPVCKKCYERYPRELRLRLKKYHDNEAANEQPKAGSPVPN